LEKYEDNFKEYLKEIPNFLSIFIIPIYFMTVSPMLIEMSKSTGISSEDLSLIITFFTIGLIAGQLTSVFFNRRFSKFKIIITCYILIILFIVLLSFVNNQLLFYALYLLVGYFAGVIWLQATRYILENNIRNKDRLIIILFSFYPLGNVIAPFISSFLINNNINWRYSYYVIALMAFVVLILYLIFKKEQKSKALNEGEEEHLPIKDIFFNKNVNIVFLLGCLLIFFYVISETIIATWSPTFLRTVKLFEIQYASLTISIFWLSSFTGRIITSFYAGKIRSNYILLILSIVAIAAMIFFIFLESFSASLVAIGFVGLGHAATIGISSTSIVYIKGRAVLTTIVLAVINIATSLAPFLTRFVSKSNMTFSVILAPIFMGITALVIVYKIIFEKKKIKDGDIPA